jgi:predicted nucleic-acid-binding protein
VIAADTNVVIRLLTDDDPVQTARARQLFETETIFLPKTMLLEAAWVLRRLYDLEPLPVSRALDKLI